MQIREKMKARALSCRGLSVMNVSVWDTAPWQSFTERIGVKLKNATQALFYLFIYCFEVFVIELT